MGTTNVRLSWERGPRNGAQLWQLKEAWRRGIGRGPQDYPTIHNVLHEDPASEQSRYLIRNDLSPDKKIPGRL